VQANSKGEAPHSIRGAFESANKFATIEVRRFGAVVRTFEVFVCKNYRTLPL
jgi:hypothetical protein